MDGLRVEDRAWSGSLSRSLLQFIILSPRRHATREAIAEALWPDTPVSQVRRRLNTAVYRIRRAIWSAVSDDSLECLERTQVGYRLSDSVWVDLWAFRRLANDLRCGDCREPDAVFRVLESAPPIKPEELDLEQPYSDWARAAFEELERDYVYLETVRADALLQSHRPREALTTLLQLFEREPTRESVAYQAMAVAFELGDKALALDVFERCRRSLSLELGLEPMPELLELWRRIVQGNSPKVSR